MASAPSSTPPSAAQHGGLEVHSGPEVVTTEDSEPKYAYQQGGGQPWPQQAGLETAYTVPPVFQVPAQEKRILGLRRPVFILSTLLLLTIVGVAVGGGVGISRAVSDAKSSNSSGPAPAASAGTTAASAVGGTSSPPSATTTTMTPTTASLILPPPTGTLAWAEPCPTGQHIVALLGQSYVFNVTCGVDYPVGVTVLALNAWSFEDCMRACASMTRNLYVLANAVQGSATGQTSCAAVEWNVDLAGKLPSNGGNCWLKHSAESPSVTGPQVGSVRNGAAVLVKTPQVP